MKIWILNGHSTDVGLWDTEVFMTKEDAIDALNSYAEEYDGSVDDLVMSSDEAYVQVEMHEI